MILLAVAHLAAPLASGPQQATVPLLAAASLLSQFGVGVLSVNRTTLIQQLVPTHALGRVAATQQVIVLAAVPIGAALGGVLGEVLGLRSTLGIAALGTIAATVALVRSPVWATSRVGALEDRPQSGEPIWANHPPMRPPRCGISMALPRRAEGRTDAETITAYSTLGRRVAPRHDVWRRGPVTRAALEHAVRASCDSLGRDAPGGSRRTSVEALGNCEGPKSSSARESLSRRSRHLTPAFEPPIYGAAWSAAPHLPPATPRSSRPREAGRSGHAAGGQVVRFDLQFDPREAKGAKRVARRQPNSPSC